MPVARRLHAAAVFALLPREQASGRKIQQLEIDDRCAQQRVHVPGNRGSDPVGHETAAGNECGGDGGADSAGQILGQGAENGIPDTMASWPMHAAIPQLLENRAGAAVDDVDAVVIEAPQAIDEFRSAFNGQQPRLPGHGREQGARNAAGAGAEFDDHLGASGAGCVCDAPLDQTGTGMMDATTCGDRRNARKKIQPSPAI